MNNLKRISKGLIVFTIFLLLIQFLSIERAFPKNFPVKFRYSNGPNERIRQNDTARDWDIVNKVKLWEDYGYKMAIQNGPGSKEWNDRKTDLMPSPFKEYNLTGIIDSSCLDKILFFVQIVFQIDSNHLIHTDPSKFRYSANFKDPGKVRLANGTFPTFNYKNGTIQISLFLTIIKYLDKFPPYFEGSRRCVTIKSVLCEYDPEKKDFDIRIIPEALAGKN